MLKTSLFIVLVCGAAVPPPAGAVSPPAGMIVHDPVSFFKTVEQYKKQVEQYKTELQSYELAVRDHIAPAAWVWDQGNNLVDGAIRMSVMLDVSRRGVHDTHDYLSRFKNVDYYRSSPCFKGKGCSEEELEALEGARKSAADDQKEFNAAMFERLKKEYDALREDIDKLRLIQLRAQDAEGQLEALGYANQLASEMINQLMQLRVLLMTQQEELLRVRQMRADREAVETAAASHLRSGKITPSPHKEW